MSQRRVYLKWNQNERRTPSYPVSCDIMKCACKLDTDNRVYLLAGGEYMDGNQRICAAAAATELSADRRTSHTASSPRGHLARWVSHFLCVCSYDTTFVGLWAFGPLTVNTCTAFFYIYFQFHIRRVLGYLTLGVEWLGLEIDSTLLCSSVIKH